MWILTKEKLPDMAKPVLVYNPERQRIFEAEIQPINIEMSLFNWWIARGSMWFSLESCPLWMPFPDIPKYV